MCILLLSVCPGFLVRPFGIIDEEGTELLYTSSSWEQLRIVKEGVPRESRYGPTVQPWLRSQLQYPINNFAFLMAPSDGYTLPASLTDDLNASGEGGSRATPFTCQNWTLQGLLGVSPHFKAVPRLSVLAHSHDGVIDAIKYHERAGLPLIISDFQHTPLWNHELLSPTWLQEHFSAERAYFFRVVL